MSNTRILKVNGYNVRLLSDLHTGFSMNHRPRKRFGQNFLKDSMVIDRILHAISAQPEDNMLEIGPGHGALTLPLLKQLKQLTVIEIDRDLQAELSKLPEAGERLHIVGEDALNVDFSRFGENVRVVGNLPYNISTPLIMRLMNDIHQIKDMHFMLQKEVVQRMAAVPGTKAYGRLTVMLQYFCEVDDLFDVPPSAFFPPPKVNSAIVRIRGHSVSPYDKVDIRQFSALVTQAFSMRRKTLANNLKKLMSAQDLEALSISPGDRPEQISIKDFVKIANFIAK